MTQHPQRSHTSKPPTGNEKSIAADGPRFAEPSSTPDPTRFNVPHASDTAAYKILDREKNRPPRPFPVVHGVTEPVLKLSQALGEEGDEITARIMHDKQIVFHVLGDTGNTHGPKDEGVVADKMVSDFFDIHSTTVPSFLYHLGDVVYSFGEAEYYYDQFYDPYRDYPAPIFAIPGNHDGMVAPNTSTPTLKAFLENFCTFGDEPHRTPEAGGLARTAQIQPGVYFTLEVPFARILGLYSNCLEDPGIISDEGGKYPYLGQTQIAFLKAGLARVADEGYEGAVIIAVHHPPYVAQVSSGHRAGRHGGSPKMLEEIDAVCAATGIWPHAILSGHAHNYQRFTRYLDGRETPFLISGNGGHAITPLTRKGIATIRVPVDQPTLSTDNDKIIFESYDDQDFGYLRIIVNKEQLRIEYHPASDGASAKTPDDFVTVDLKTRKLVHFRTH